MTSKYLVTKAYKIDRRNDRRAKAARQSEAFRADEPKGAAGKRVRRALAAFCTILALGCAGLPQPALARSGGNHGHHSK